MSLGGSSTLEEVRATTIVSTKQYWEDLEHQVLPLDVSFAED